ncbi:MAG: 2,3-bisphosphoglycerate-independent phosphoglycerate mutase [Mariprofundaceae bacterium]|nr:2,3-bisphosphoglycerate-independent phosphoglycerate mutase [Mariprofundaceae bacterium]
MSIAESTAISKPVLLVVMDGWGLGCGDQSDAVAQANTPHFDHLWKSTPHTTLLTHGAYVGLSSEKDLGGSEVGHLTMGAGRLLDQGSTRINHSIKNSSFFQSKALKKIIACSQQEGTLHLIGLLSDGNIHSHIDHFIAVIHHADTAGVARLRIHALLDGRDVGVQTADDYVLQLDAVFDSINQSSKRDYAFASAGGRETITMDRDHQWNKVKEGWDAHVHGYSNRYFSSMREAITTLRIESAGIIDQDLPSFVIVDKNQQACGAMHGGDAVIMMNFRSDRAIELCEAFCLEDFNAFDRGDMPDVCFAGMMVYDEDRNLPPLQLMEPTVVKHTLARLLVEKGIRQFRLSETQKYPHVTFFFNGGYREPLDPNLEDYILIPSDQGLSFADKPKMQSVAITKQAKLLMAKGEYGFGLINYPNADMVGHCGKLAAAIEAVEAVDVAIGALIACADAHGWAVIITADHGNAEEMCVVNKHGQKEASTRHSLNPVPCIVHDSMATQQYQLRQAKKNMLVPETPGLSHIAATVLQLMGLNIPDGYADSLIIRSKN